MKTGQSLLFDGAADEEFCPECGQPLGWTGVAPAAAEQRRGGLIVPWILIVVCLCIVVSLMSHAWTDYQFVADTGAAAGAATSEHDLLAARDHEAIARVYLAYDVQERSLAFFIGAVGISIIARRKLAATISRPLLSTILKAWALGEAVGICLVNFLLGTCALILVGRLSHGERLSLDLLDQAWRISSEIVLRSLDAFFVGLP
ncbi:MAG TPA: hypothetical protein VFZ25_21345 [Chloroflexota bacterium]|nr:hypothetical protein [Chloroflexota bacterium]